MKKRRDRTDDPAADFVRACLAESPDLEFDAVAERARAEGLTVSAVTFLQVSREFTSTPSSSKPAADLPSDLPTDRDGVEPADRFRELLAAAAAGDADGGIELAVVFRPGLPGNRLQEIGTRLTRAAHRATPALEDADVSGSESAADGSEAALFLEAGDLAELERVVRTELDTLGLTAELRLT